MHLRAKIPLCVAALMIVLGACCALYYYTSVRVDTSTIEYIESMQKGPYEFLDLASDINVESVDDIGYIVKGEYQIVIHYGDQVIEMNRNCFGNSSYHDALGKIGLKVLSKKLDDGSVVYKVTCWNEPVTEWSRVD